MLESIEKLRESSHLDDEKWTLSDGRVMWVTNGEPNDINAVNWGEQWRKIADEIEREISEKYMELPCDCEGVPIQMWDRVKAEGYEDGKVASIEVRSNGTDWIGVLPDGWDTPTVYRSDCLRHYKQRTVEDVLMDVMSDFADADFNDETLETITARYADEIRGMLGSDAR